MSDTFKKHHLAEYYVADLFNPKEVEPVIKKLELKLEKPLQEERGSSPIACWELDHHKIIKGINRTSLLEEDAAKILRALYYSWLIDFLEFDITETKEYKLTKKIYLNAIEFLKDDPDDISMNDIVHRMLIKHPEFKEIGE